MRARTYRVEVTSLRARARFGALGSVGLLAIGVASPAGAIPAPVDGCGAEPEGADLTRSGDVCQLAFTTPGEYSWTVPSGLSAIHAVLTGAGGGAQAGAGGGNAVGYAGSGGSVAYADFSERPAGSALDILVGAGGATETTDDGEGTSVLAPPLEWWAPGGQAGTVANPPCELVVPNVFTFLTVGQGAKAQPTPDDFSCAARVSPGISPSSDDDSRGHAPLALFADSVDELGRGGAASLLGAIVQSSALTAGLGAGADIVFAADGELLADPSGDSGSVIIRYPAAASAPAPEPELDAEVESAPELAETGAAEAAPLAGLAALLLGLGTAAVAVSRRRAQKN